MIKKYTTISLTPCVADTPFIFSQPILVKYKTEQGRDKFLEKLCWKLQRYAIAEGYNLDNFNIAKDLKASPGKFFDTRQECEQNMVSFTTSIRKFFITRVTWKTKEFVIIQKYI